MNDKNKDRPSESQLNAPQRLTDDLQALYNPPEPIPMEIERAIIDRARSHFDQRRIARRRRSRLVFRWAAAATAAAAVLVISFMTYHEGQSDKAPPLFAEAIVLNRDLDQNGRVDILDAFYLARRIKAAGELVPQWDFNGDGNINRADVDIVAQAAVRLGKEGL